MGTAEPKSEAGLRRYAGPGGFDQLLSDMQGEAFRMSYTDAIRLTYRQAWDRFVADAVKESKEDTSEPTQEHRTPRRAGRTSGAFNVETATEKEANDFFDKLCGNRVYDGPKWWIPGEVEGIEHYNG